MIQGREGKVGEEGREEEEGSRFTLFSVPREIGVDVGDIRTSTHLLRDFCDD